MDELFAAAPEVKPQLDLLARMAAELLARGSGEAAAGALPEAAAVPEAPAPAGPAVPPLLYGCAFEARWTSPGLRQLARALRREDADLAAELGRAAHLLETLSRWGSAARREPLHRLLAETARWAEEYALSLGSRITVAVRPEDFPVHAVLARELGTLLKSVFSAALPLRLRDREHVVPVQIGAREKPGLIMVLVAGLPSFRRAATIERLEVLGRALAGVGGRLWRDQQGTEVVMDFPLLVHSIEVLVARAGAGFLGLPAYRVREVREVGEPAEKPAYQGRPLPVEDLRPMPGSGCLVVLEGTEGPRGVLVDRLLGRQELLVEALPTGQAFALAVEDGRRIPLVDPARPAPRPAARPAAPAKEGAR